MRYERRGGVWGQCGPLIREASASRGRKASTGEEVAPGQGALRLQGSCPWGPASLTEDLVTMPSPRKPLEGGLWALPLRAAGASGESHWIVSFFLPVPPLMEE